MNYHKIIKKWASLRHPDPKFANVAIGLYEGLDKKERAEMIQECRDYIDAVQKGAILPSTPTIPIRVFKK